MSPTARCSTTTVWTILRLAVWFGLLTALGDAVLLTANTFTSEIRQGSLPDLSKVEWLFEYIWVVGLVNVFLFLIIAVAGGLVGRQLFRERTLQLLVFSLSFWMMFDWLLTLERIGHTASFVLAVGIGVTVMRVISSHQPQFVSVFQRMLPWLALAAICWVIATSGAVWVWRTNQLRQRPAALPGEPNVLVIVLDTLRADHLSALGYPRPTTPYIDHLAQAGALFENGVATSSWTLPSHAAMLTGRYDHGAVLNNFDGRHIMLGELLQGRGYRTGAFSGNNWYFARWVGLGRGFDKFADVNYSLFSAVLKTPIGHLIKTRILDGNFLQDHPSRKWAPQVNKEFLRWVKKTSPRPFFAFLNYYDPHDPYLPPEPFRSRFASKPNPGGLVNNMLRRVHPVLNSEQLQSEIEAYDGAIAHADHNLGLLFEQLQAQGFLSNTIVVITSDHGESFGEHNMTGHRTSLYWDLLRVPIVVWAPGRVPAGVRVQQPVSTAALPATILDLIGVPDRPTFSVDSLAPFWKEPGLSKEDSPLSELVRMRFEEQNLPLYKGSLKAVISPEWHYIIHETLGEELYAWASDPREEHNLADSPEGKAAIQQLSRLISGPPAPPQ